MLVLEVYFGLFDLNIGMPDGEEFNRRWAVYEAVSSKSKPRRTKKARANK